MEIDITSFFENADAFEFSHSIAEGGQTAGKDTWNAAKREGQETPLLTTEAQLNALRRYVKGFGAWSNEEIAAWSDVECNALFIQFVSGDMREAELDNGEPDWDAYEKDAEEGRYSGNIYRGGDGRVYFNLSR